MRSGSLHFLLICLMCCCGIQSARILGILPLWARSHHRSLQAIMRTLAEAGHDVVVYSPYPMDNPPPTYTHVFLENVSTGNEALNKLIQACAKLPDWKSIDCMWYFFDIQFEMFIGDKKVKELIQSKENFDLVIVEAFTIQEYALVFGHIFNAPTIALQTFFTNGILNSQLGNTLALTYIPDLGLGLSNKMSFLERSLNSFTVLRGLYYYHNWYLPRVEETLKRHFPNAPPLKEMIGNISLTFVNEHLTADYAFPRPPNSIAVAGIHIPPEKPLPQNIKTFMDEAQEGVILFSMGSLVPDEMFPKSYFDSYVNVFKKLRQRVLWKTRKEDIEGLPENVMTAKWLPQPDVLAHPNCVLFITHGGLNSQHETIHFGVPIVGIPHFFDQIRNVLYFVEKQVGVWLKDVSEEGISTAIHTVVDDPMYRENMKRLSLIFRDRPMSPAESVVYWTEYVLRHRGAGHLRPASMELTWYQLALLDVLAVILAVAVTVGVLSYLAMRKILTIVRGVLKNNVNTAKKYN